MLRECRIHGYFRADECPICGEHGKFLMNDEELGILGRTMAGVLRHFPERYYLKMDEHGWVDLNEFIDSIHVRQKRFKWLRSHHILAVIDTDPKGRYQFRDGKIRATYAHSIPVDLDLPTKDVPDELFYPTTKEELEILLETGLKPSDRKMVHLSKTLDAAKAAGAVRDLFPVIIRIDAKSMIDSGCVIKKAGTTVYLADDVKPEFLEVVKETLEIASNAQEAQQEETEEILPEKAEEELPAEEEEIKPKKTKKTAAKPAAPKKRGRPPKKKAEDDE
ncbi:MAG: RNA 2'-phosphotransferase [Candidatus Dadabacteria bacterium]|nr:RNA 2'-phosphotransferase [Candidatus Dadabacteria bacterium]